MLQPNIHTPNPIFLPTAIREFVRSSAANTSKGDSCCSLKKVTGLKSLNMELSWTPFQFGCKIPTDEDVSRVNDEFEFPGLIDIDSSKITNLLERAAMSSNTINNLRGWNYFDANIEPTDIAQFEIMLTREERRRTSKVSDYPKDDRLSDQIELHPFHTSDGDGENETPDITARGLAKSPSCAWDVALDGSGVSFARSPSAAGDRSLVQDQFVNDLVLHQETDKENVPPVLHYPQPRQFVDIHGLYQDQDSFPFETPSENTVYGAFVPLSFDSSHGPSHQHSQTYETDQEFIHDECTTGTDKSSFSKSLLRRSASHEVLVEQVPGPTDAIPSSNSTLNPAEAIHDTLLTSTHATFAARSLAEFMAWRNKPGNLASFNVTDRPNAAEISSDHIPSGTPSAGYVTPENIVDQNTLFLPSPWQLPPTLHRYLASIDLLQKRSIVHFLGVSECAVELVERSTLGGVDLILDSDTAVVFASLMALPSQCEALAASLGRQSWRYLHVLVIFEGFSSSLAYKFDPTSTRLAPNPYTPPILKAIKKLRRDLGIAEALETKNPNASIKFAFANSVQEAALFTRCFGDIAEANDITGGAIWGPRAWLDVEEQEVQIH
jgi:hypothetical protein